MHGNAADAVLAMPEDVEVQREPGTVDADLAEDAVLRDPDQVVPAAAYLVRVPVRRELHVPVPGLRAERARPARAGLEAPDNGRALAWTARAALREDLGARVERRHLPQVEPGARGDAVQLLPHARAERADHVRRAERVFANAILGQTGQAEELGVELEPPGRVLRSCSPRSLPRSKGAVALTAMWSLSVFISSFIVLSSRWCAARGRRRPWRSRDSRPAVRG